MTVRLIAGLGAVVIGLALSACTEGVKTEDDRAGVVSAKAPTPTTTTVTIPLPGSRSDPLTEYTRYTQTFGTPCNPLLDICLE